MTEKKIHYALSRIKQCKENKYPLEALIRTYHLNIDMMKFILLNVNPKEKLEGKKIKELVKSCHSLALTNPKLKATISKSSIKLCRAYFLNMDLFFKKLKTELPGSVASVQNDSEKICAILKLSVNKVLSNARK